MAATSFLFRTCAGVTTCWSLLICGCGDPPHEAPAAAPAVLADAELLKALRGRTLVVELDGVAEPVTGAALIGSVPSAIRRLRDGAEMVLVPGGRFLMGAREDEGRYYSWGNAPAFPSEVPQHEVTLSKWYYMDRFEVTNRRFAQFVEHLDPSEVQRLFGRRHSYEKVAWGGRRGEQWRFGLEGEPREQWEELPVAMVTWEQAAAYARWAQAELPSEAEFERALRGRAVGAVWPWGNEVAKGGVTWANVAGTQDRFQGRAPVGSFAANDFGLHDLLGNVAEWCVDAFDARAYASPTRIDPVATVGALDSHVDRGASFVSTDGSLRCAARMYLSGTCTKHIGFRLVRRVRVAD